MPKSKKVTVQVRVLPEEKELWQSKAKEQWNNNLSSMIRNLVNHSVETSGLNNKIDEILLSLKALNLAVEEIRQKK